MILRNQNVEKKKHTVVIVYIFPFFCRLPLFLIACSYTTDDKIPGRASEQPDQWNIRQRSSGSLVIIEKERKKLLYIGDSYLLQRYNFKKKRKRKKNAALYWRFSSTAI